MRGAKNQRLQSDLKKSQETTRRLKSLQSKILKIVSHDFRTPLASIRGYSELLRSGAKGLLTDGQKKMLEIVIHEVDYLNGLIGEALDLSLLDAGQFRLDKQPIPFQELIQKAIPRIGLASELKEIPVETSLDPGLPVVEVDVARMVQVITNVVRGLIKHASKDGRILMKAAQTNGMVELKITQSGESLPVEQWQALLMPARRREKPNGAEAGLRIAFELALAVVRAHGGQMGVESRPKDGGAAFWIRMPAIKED